ncbi:MAG: hypothetical protein R3E91_03545 [Chlamydiales bacterium]
MSTYHAANNSMNFIQLNRSIQETANPYPLNREVIRTLDTIADLEKKEEKRQVEIRERPVLPEASQSSDPNYLGILAEAFSKAFASMSEGSIQQVQSYAELQQLNETISQSVFQSMKLAIDKEEKQINAVSIVNAYQEKCSEVDKVLNWVLFGVGIAMILGTIVSCVFDGGASAAALPEEIELLSDLSVEEIGTLDEAVDAAPEFSENLEIESNDAVEIPEENLNIEGESSQQETEINQANRDTTNEMDRVNREGARSKSNWKKRLLHMLIGAGFGTPSLVKAIQEMKTYDLLKQTADSQKEVGEALAILHQNNLYFQFYQHLVQQTGSVVQEETKNSAELVETFGEITNAYQQISYGLAQAV